MTAHDNRYNRWVAGDSALYFDSIDRSITALMSDPGLANRLGEAAFRRHLEEFTWTDVAKKYEEVLLQYVKNDRRAQKVDVEC
jgi:glycosyltransferase involved in cell wall biosynthesis